MHAAVVGRRISHSATLAMAFAMIVGITLVAGDQRTVLMNVGSDPPSVLGKASIDIMHSLPRYGGGKTQMGIIDPDDDQLWDDLKDYVLGILLPFGVALGLGLITWTSCWTFCCGRSCCNSCGGRTASRSYTKKDQLYLKIGIVLLGAGCITLFVLGIISNAAVSSSLDDTYANSDALVEHIFKFNGPISDMNAIAHDALAQVRGLNASVLKQLPTAAEAVAWSACASTMLALTQSELLLLTQSSPLTGSVVTDTGGATPPNFNLSSLAQQLSAVSQGRSTLPDLTDQSRLAAEYNRSLANGVLQPIETTSKLTTTISTSQSMFRQSSLTSSNITGVLYPLLGTTSPTIEPLRSLTQQYVTSGMTSTLTEQQSLYNHINTNDVSMTTVNETNRLDLSLNQLPSSNDYIQALNMFDVQFQQLRSISSNLAFTFGTYVTLLTDLQMNVSPNFSQIVTNLQEYRFPNDSSSLETSLRTTSTSVNTFVKAVGELAPNLHTTIVEGGLENLYHIQTNTSYSSSPNLAQSLRTVNTSLTTTNGCASNVLTRLLNLNQTVVQLTSRINGLVSRRSQLLVQLQRLGRIKYDLGQTYIQLSSLQSILGTFPNLTLIEQGISELNHSTSLFEIDLNEAANMIQTTTRNLNNLTPMNLEALKIGYDTYLNATRSATLDVTNFETVLRSLQTSIASFPNNFGTYTLYATTLAGRVSELRPILDQVLPIIRSATSLTQPLKGNFLTRLQAFTTVFSLRPDHDSLFNMLNQLDQKINVTRNTTYTSIVNRLSMLESSATTYADSSSVSVALNGVATATRPNNPLGNLIEGTPYRRLNLSLTILPNLTTSLIELTQFSQRLEASSGLASLRQVEYEIQSGQDFIQQADVTELSIGLTAMAQLSNSFPDLVSPIESLELAAKGLQDATDTMIDYRHEYYVARQSTVVFKNHIDWLRLLGFMLVLFVPICVTACGLISWTMKKPSATHTTHIRHTHDTQARTHT